MLLGFEGDGGRCRPFRACVGQLSLPAACSRPDSGVDGEVHLGYQAPIADWNRAKTQVDLAVVCGAENLLVAELKVWDVGHQLFDVAKVCCLLKAGAEAAFMLCIAEAPDALSD